MKKITPLLLLLCLLCATVFAQKTDDAVFSGCATDQQHQQHPEFQKAQTQHDEAAYRAALKRRTAPQAEHAALRTLPVVVHIVHNGGVENISDARVQQGIAHLNAAFNATFGTGVNTDIQFCLAQRDPQGGITAGITRDQSTLTSFNMDNQDLALKNLNRWQPTCYINIWVVAAINSSSSGNGVIGYAYFPGAHGSAVDGIVMEAAYFGSSQANSGVLVHEMGHYLGLYHTFQGGCGNNDCLLQGDRVCDTPPDQTTFSSCNPNANSCNTDTDDPSANNPFTTDVPDLGEDYMDYSSLSCFSKFTQGQSERMNWFVTNVRSSLLGCLSCATPCPAPLAASITAPAGPQIITIGTTLNFSATASNSSTYAWNVGNAAPFATALTASRTFNTTGTFWVKFKALSGDPARCADAADSVQVKVICDAQAIFSVPPIIVNSTAVTFTNSSTGATTYAWSVDNTTVATTPDLTYTFPATGSYTVCLRVTGTDCDNTFCAAVEVRQSGDPTEGCDNTFIRSLNNMGGALPGIFPHPNGDFFATGLRNDSTVIVRFNQGGVAQWAKAFRFGNNVHQIRDMFVDASGDLIGTAQAEPLALGSLVAVVFRYNLTTETFTWVRRMPGAFYTQIHALDANNCVVSGLANSGRTQLTRINKNTGAISGYNLEGEQGDYYSTLHNGVLYGACRRYYTSSGDFRAAVFAHDATTGAFQWQNSIISDNSAGDTRMYPEKPIVDGNELVVVASGDLDGFGVPADGPTDLVVAKTSLTGDVQWTRRYIVGNNLARLVASAIVSTASGYYVVGNLYDPALGNYNFGYIIKITKQGTVQWGRRLGISGKNIVRNVMERNGYLYLTMSSDSYSPNALLLLKLDQQGNTNTSCGFVKSINIEGVSLPNIQNKRNYTVSTSGPTPMTVNTTARATPANATTYCVTPCACPDLDISAGPDTSVCKGAPVQLQATPGLASYNWTPAAGLSNPNIINPLATPAVTTTYILNGAQFGAENIQNGDFTQGNTAFTSQYTANTTGFGTYNVTTNPTLFNGQWKIPLDHSPSADNLMMMVDGSTQGSAQFFWRQTVPVEANTNYRFDLWGAMAFPASPPNIRVSVNGTVQATFNLVGGNNAVGVWQPFGFNLTSGAATQLDIVLTDLNAASGGNDFAVDDISLRRVCTYADSVTVTVRGSTGQVLGLGPDVSACTNAVRTFDAGSGFAAYRWQDGSTDRIFTAFGPGTYSVEATDSCGGIQRDTVLVQTTPAPTLDLGADLSICAGKSTPLTFSTNGTFVTYNWSPAAGLSCTVCPNPVATPSATTKYYLAASTADGCTNLDSVTVLVKPNSTATITATQCVGKPFIFNGKIYTTGGTYTETLIAANGCDSMLTLQLSFVPLPTNAKTVAFCAGESVSIGGKIYTQPGTVVDTVAAIGSGCDTIVTYTLNRLPLPTRAQTVAFCAGESVSIGGKIYTQPGTVVDTVAATGSGCDTVVTYTLNRLPLLARTQTVAFCAGESVSIGGKIYTQPGTVADTVAATGSGCDTIVTYTLNRLPLLTRAQTVAFCAGESVSIGGKIYTQPGTVVDTVAATGSGCDTIVTYTLNRLPLLARAQTVAFCSGESVSIGGKIYTQPGTVVDTVAATGSGCDTIVTYTLKYLTPAPSVVMVQCPNAINIAVLPGAGPTLVTYALPTASTDCICPGTALALTSGLPSGSTFPPGTTLVCYTARDSCGNTSSCCFPVMIREMQACDTKEIGCLKYELLTITADAGQNYTYRIRVTNKCANELIYTAIQTPNGVTALKPLEMSTFEAESGRKYTVRNPNYTPFYSIRFKSVATGIANGQSDIFRYTLPAQSDPDYIHITSQLATLMFYEAHLNTFNCPIGITPPGGISSPDDRDFALSEKPSGLRIFPNPTAGELFADLSAWSGQPLRVQVLNAQGQLVQTASTVAGESAYALQLPAGLADGLYVLEVLTGSGEREALRFVVQGR